MSLLSRTHKIEGKINGIFEVRKFAIRAKSGKQKFMIIRGLFYFFFPLTFLFKPYFTYCSFFKFYCFIFSILLFIYLTICLFYYFTCESIERCTMLLERYYYKYYFYFYYFYSFNSSTSKVAFLR